MDVIEYIYNHRNKEKRNTKNINVKNPAIKINKTYIIDNDDRKQKINTV